MLRIGLAKLLHKLPDEIDTMDWEDALAWRSTASMEREEFEKRSKKSGGAGEGQTQTANDEERRVMKRKNTRSSR